MPSHSTVDVLHLDPRDNVCVALRALESGREIRVAGTAVRLAGPVAMGHKIALTAVEEGEPILKYGQPIGLATRPIAPGQWVHTHNLSISQFRLDYAPATEIPPDPAPIRDRTFLGYRRPDGKAGTRNYVAVISTVNCSASVSKYVAERFDAGRLKEYPQVDGVVALTHGDGCGIQFGGSKHEALNRVMGGFARHPNIGAVLIIGLGCEQTSTSYLLESQGLVQIGDAGGAAAGPPVLSIQACGGTVKTVEAGVRTVAELLPRANDVRRSPIPASELIVATQCGGSDGSSGITCNPALGAAADRIVACGGTVILGETTETSGAEHLLTRRARSPEVAEKLVERIRWWRWYANIFGDQLDGNPSVGNKEGGLTTITEKSLGAIAKGGTTALMEVYRYAEPVTAKGLVFVDSPGFDPPSITGMVAGGAQVIAFTTGRGSCFGCKPSPSIKIASNTPMFQRLEDDMDIDAGVILQGRTVQEVGEQILEEILAVASGKKTKSEIHGIGDEEFVPWAVGPTL